MILQAKRTIRFGLGWSSIPDFLDDADMKKPPNSLAAGQGAGDSIMLVELLLLADIFVGLTDDVEVFIVGIYIALV
jgi:hypothetical protein